MKGSRNLVDSYYNRDISLHKPGVIPNTSRIISPITSNRHKYQLKQRIWPKKTVESWFTNHSPDERRAVFSFLDTLYNDDDDDNQKYKQYQKSANPRLSHRINTTTNYSSPRKLSSNHHQDSRASKRDLGEVLQSLESVRPSSSVQEKGVQTSSTAFTVPLPSINNGTNSKCPSTSIVKHSEIVEPSNSLNVDDKYCRRYLSQTWRVINPREDVQPIVRPDHNSSSFFNYTKKTYPEYFFIHPDWY